MPGADAHLGDGLDRSFDFLGAGVFGHRSLRLSV
jgi:hypothetical protein